MFQVLEVLGYIIIGIGILLMFIAGVHVTKGMFSVGDQSILKTHLIKGLKFFGLCIPVIVIGFALGIYGSSSLSHQKVIEIYVLTQEDVSVLDKNSDEWTKEEISQIENLRFKHLSPDDIEKYYDKVKEANAMSSPPTYPKDLFEKNFKETTIYQDKYGKKE